MLTIRAMTLAAALLTAPLIGAETLLVVAKSGDALHFVDPGSGLHLASAKVGRSPHEVSRSPDGRLAAVTNYGTQAEPGSSVSIVDLETAAELRRIDLGAHARPHGVAWFADDRIAVTTQGSRHLLLLDPDAGRIVSAIGTDQEGSHMVAIASGAVRAFVANTASGSTTAIDLASGRKLGDVETGKGSEAIAVTPDGGEVWVAARDTGAITVFDARTLEISARLSLAGAPIRIAFSPDGGTAFVSCAASSEVVAFDVRARREIARRRIDVEVPESARSRPSASLALGSVLPVGLAVSPDGASVFVAASMADKVVQLATPGLEMLRVFDVAGEPDGMALTPVMPKAECHACEAPAESAPRD
jgi:DNA-binding beta-propeller fold protein YncE